MKLKIKNLDYQEVEQVEELLKGLFPNRWSKGQILSTNPYRIKKSVYLGDTLVGFFEGEVILDEGAVLMLAVKKEFQGKGIGKSILNWFISYCKKQGVKNVWLEVSAENQKAIQLYSNLGFIEKGRRKKYYTDGSDAVVMGLQL
ncbi:MAG: ribosomal protein S18-alanine N-acetyltransferase [Aquificae bacterium]|nr:ribosomal protein S18-alanine N-acetyltransferase [Aquificota bacterium]